MKKKKCPECGSKLIKGKFYWVCSGDNCEYWEFFGAKRKINNDN